MPQNLDGKQSDGEVEGNGAWVYIFDETGRGGDTVLAVGAL